MQLQFQPNFDGSAYNRAKAKSKPTTTSAKPKFSKRPPTISTVKQDPRPSNNVEIDSDDEYPSVDELLNTAPPVYDLTGVQDPPLEQLKSVRQQLTPETDGTHQGGETDAHEVSTRYSETDHRRSSPNGGEGSANGLDLIEPSGKDDGQQPTPPHISPASAHELGDAVDLSNAAPSPSGGAVSNTGGNHLAPEVAPPTGTSLQHIVEHNPHKLSARSGQLADSDESATSDTDACPDSPMEGVEEPSNGEGVPPGEWEVEEIIGEEEIHGVLCYLVAWKATLEPKGNLEHLKELIEEWKADKDIHGVPHYLVTWKATLEPESNLEHAKEMIEEWNVEKARALREKQRSDSGIKKPGTGGKHRAKKGRAGSNGRKRGRPRLT